MHGVLVLKDGGTGPVLFALASAMIDDHTLQDVINCRSVFVVVYPEHTARFGRDNAQTQLASSHRLKLGAQIYVLQYLYLNTLVFGWRNRLCGPAAHTANNCDCSDNAC